MGWVTGWQYRANVVLPTFTSEQTDLNYSVTVPLLAGMNADFSDIRFVDSDGTTLLKQHMESYDAANSLWWIKVPTSPIIGKTIHVYFGNTGASALDDGADVFVFFDDFSGDLSKWSTSGDVSIVSSQMVLNMVGGADISSFGAFSYGDIGFRASVALSGGSANEPRRYIGIGGSSSGADEYVYYYNGQGGPEWKSYGNTYLEETAASNGNSAEHIYDTKCITSAKRKFYYDDGLEATHEAGTPYTSTHVRFRLYSTFAATATLKVSWVYIYQLPNDGTEVARLTLSEGVTVGKINREAVVALEQTASTWGTAVPPGALDEIKVLELSPLLDKRELLIEKTAGLFYPKYGELGRKKVSPEIKALARYSGRIWSLAAQLMGLDTVSGIGPYAHLMTLEDTVDGSDKFSSLFACLGLSTVGHRFEWPSVKPQSISISGPNSDGYIEMDIKTLANTMNLNSDCTAIITDFEAVTHMQLNGIVAPIIPFSNGLFRINTQSGAALASGDTLRIRSFNFEFSRMIDHEFDSQGSLYYEWQSSEPVDNGMMDSKLTIEVGDMDSSVFLESFQDETKKKADLLFSLDANYSLKIEWPSLLISDMEPALKGHDRFIHRITLVPLQALSNPTGMAFDKWRMTVTDNNSVAYE